MNPTENELHYPLGDALPVPGGTLPVGPDGSGGWNDSIRWVRMRLPFALDHINLWLLRDEIEGPEGPVQGWTVVDCCISRDESRAQWEEIFAQELDGLPILRVIVTHMHPDHVGLAHWLCERWSTPQQPCRLWMSATDYNLARIGSASSNGFGGDAAAVFFAQHGLRDPASLKQIRERSSYYASLVPQIPAQYRRMLDGDVLVIGARKWRCIVGYGHAPEHISLYCEEIGVLIGGDMMLPRISSNVSVFEMEPEANPLQLFLDSLDRLRSLPTGTLTLPSHGKPFVGLHQRVDQLHAHHRDRLDEVEAACRAQPCSAADALPVLFKRALDLHQTTFAMGESIAHLNALWLRGRLRRRLDAEGVFRFHAAT